MSKVLSKSWVACVAVTLILSGCGASPPEELSPSEAPAYSSQIQEEANVQKIEPMPSELPLDPSVISTPKGLTCAPEVAMKEIPVKTGEVQGFDGKIELLLVPSGQIVRIEWLKSTRASTVIVDGKQWGKVSETHQLTASYMYNKEWAGGLKKLVICSRGGED